MERHQLPVGLPVLVMRVVRELKFQQLARLARKGMKLEAVNPVSSILLSSAAESELDVAIVTLAIQRSEEGQALGRIPGSGSKSGSVGISMAARTCQTCKRCCRRKQWGTPMPRSSSKSVWMKWPSLIRWHGLVEIYGLAEKAWCFTVREIADWSKTR